MADEVQLSSTQTSSQQRVPLSRDRVLQGAVEVADLGGIDALTMRNIAQHLGVEAMSLYYHVDNQASLLDGTVEVTIGEILEAVAVLDAPDPEHDWKGTLRQRTLAARDVLLRHKWAPAVIEQRSTMSPSVIFYYEGILEIMRRGGSPTTSPIMRSTLWEAWRSDSPRSCSNQRTPRPRMLRRRCSLPWPTSSLISPR